MGQENDDVAIYSITQATTATFSDLYLQKTFLFFIEKGSKRIVTQSQDLTAGEGDLLIFPSGTFVTMENRPVLDSRYHAIGIAFPDQLVKTVFGGHSGNEREMDRVQHIGHERVVKSNILPLILETHDRQDLPDVVKRTRMLEPLIWLRQLGFHIPVRRTQEVFSRVRQCVDADLSHDWRAAEVAHRLAMSEATMRRALAQTGISFSQILSNARLEYGLTMLQTTDKSISAIALACGFKTPSHFSDVFRKRFQIRPKDIRFNQK